MREPEVLCQLAQAVRLLDRVEVGSLEVLDQSEDELFVGLHVVAHDGGNRGQARNARSTPAPLARDQLIAVDVPAHEQRLQHAMRADRVCELGQRLRVEARAHLLVRRPDLVDGDHLRHHRAAFA